MGFFSPQPKGGLSKKAKVIKAPRPVSKMVVSAEELKLPKSELVANIEKVVANMVANSKHGKYADKEKRRIYQRDLMRKRRAV